MTLHIRQVHTAAQSIQILFKTANLAPYCLLKLPGKNSHHIIEASFKAFARALR
jgi:imidazoleglycerol phosphate dehydratase HisB